MTVLFVAVSGPNIYEILGCRSFQRRFPIMSLSSSSIPEIIALKVAIELRSRRK